MEDFPWDQVKSGDLRHLHLLLFSSSISHRAHGLQEVHNHNDSSLSPQIQRDILDLLLRTYSLYIDRPSRRLAHQCLRSLLRYPVSEPNLKYLIQRLQDECSKPSLAPASAFALVEWCSVLLQHLRGDPSVPLPAMLDVIVADAKALDALLSVSPRLGMKKSALQITRRALRAVFTSQSCGDEAVRQSVSRLANDSASALRNASFMGVICGVCAHLPAKRPILEEVKEPILRFYVKEIISSRNAVPSHAADGLGDFFSSFVSYGDIVSELIPVLEKSILRSPEAVFGGLITSLCSSLPAEIDLSEILYSRLLKHFLSNMKSNSATIRQGAVQSLESLLSKCKIESWLRKVASDTVGPLKSITNPDQRAAYAQVLSAITPSTDLSKELIQGLILVVTKESSEVALEQEINAFCEHLTLLLRCSVKINDDVTNVVVKGSSDKRIPFRKLWQVNVGEMLWNCSHQVLAGHEVNSFVNKFMDKMKELFNEIALSPLQLAQAGGLSAAYIYMALLERTSAQGSSEATWEDIVSRLMVTSPKPSFLLNPRVYSKLTSLTEARWTVRGLAAVASASRFDAVENTPKVAWAQAFIYAITATGLPTYFRRQAAHTLSDVYLKKFDIIGRVIIDAVWTWILAFKTAERESAAASAGPGSENHLHRVLKAICPPAARLNEFGDLSFLKSGLVELLILCRPEIIRGASWISLCLRTGTDPGNLVREYADKCINQLTGVLEDPVQTIIPGIDQAILGAASDLAFVAPDIMIRRLVSQIRDDLDVGRISKFTPTDVAIARTPEGTMCVDILSAKTKQPALNKSTRDYDTLKWEEELRAQLAEKRGQKPRKLTADEQAKVNAQLAKEAEIRQEVHRVSKRIERGTGLINGLAASPATGAEDWINPAVSLLLTLARANIGIFVDGIVSKVYVRCAERMSPRLGNLRPFIGVATLRAIGKTYLLPEMEAEPLGSLVTRILYRLRFVAEQRPLDEVSLAYVLPLIFVVLDGSGIEEDKGEGAGEQVLLALEFLSFHSGSFTDARLPRAETIRQLISSMKRYSQHYKLIKDTLFDFCRTISSTMSQEELHALLEAAIAPEVSVRTSVLQVISDETDLTDFGFSEHIWLACHDHVEENAELAETIWEENNMRIEDDSFGKIMGYLQSKDLLFRGVAARALAHAVEFKPTVFKDIVAELQEKYSIEAKPKEPEMDKYGMPIKADLTDHWETRSGIALALNAMSSHFEGDQIVSLLKFLIEDGPLTDRSSAVRTQMENSGKSVIAIRGQERIEELMKVLETTLETSDKATERSDLLNESVVVLYGSLACHLQADDPRLQLVIRKLLATLPTPSETVQSAVSGCLPNLIRLSGHQSAEYVQRMLDQILRVKNYAIQRGAAYGLAGIVSGRGISTLREFRIMSLLKEAAENKAESHQRRGALLAYELLSIVLGRVFEPYVILIVPQLLTLFGDPNADVRDACLDAAKACFASLSSYGVKQILPTLLDRLDDTQWRSQKGACDLLGVMAYLDPQQLAQSLPDIIPPLTVALNDTHKEVRNAANRSLQRFGEVIDNPEVKSLVGILLKALSDPTKYTDEALDALIKVSFAHYLDAPSLALVVRILERGLGDRSNTKRKSAQIIGSLAHLTERRDLISHLPIIVSGLQHGVVDPVPTTRATASRALGSLIEKLGEDALPDLIPTLMSTLKSDTGAVDRLGSAQALSEVLAGLGTTRLEETLPTILQNVSSTKATVREGFMTLFIFLPACFGNSFAAYLSKIIPSILAGLADDVDSIQEIALRAGRLLVKNFASKAIDLLLPELERGLADNSYRIRLSSVELVGDLLFSITGISAKADTEEDEVSEAAQAGQSLLEVLGEERRNRVLSALFICRCDTSGAVKGAAMSVWKALVSSPRALKDMVPTLSQLIIRRLGSSNMEHKVIASNALGDLIKKAGESVLSSLLPLLEDNLRMSLDIDVKQGICIALRELIATASPETLEDYEKTLISAVRVGLVDGSADVREAAAEAFDTLQNILGKRVVDQVLPYLLSLLRDSEDAEQALSALLTLLTEQTRANAILPNLIRTLLTPPISVFNAKALGSLSKVAGPAMTRRLPATLNTLMDSAISAADEAYRVEMETAFGTVLNAVDEFDGLNFAMSTILDLIKHDDHRRRASAANHLARFISDSSVDFSRYYPDLIRVLLTSFDDRDKDVVKAAWNALNGLTLHMRKEEMEVLVVPVRQALREVGVPGSDLAGFSLPKGITAILPVFIQGLLNGSVEQRTQAALAIGDIVDRTGVESLKLSVTQITGPLIRAVSERSVDIKCAIFSTLNKLLEKIPTAIKPFLPQLLRTYARGLADTLSETLRSRAASGLGILITLTPRVDPLVAELITGSKTGDPGVRNAMMKTLQEVVRKAGSNMSEPSKSAILALIDDDATERTDTAAIANARLLGDLVRILPAATSAQVIRNRVLTAQLTHGSVLRLNALLAKSPSLLTSHSMGEVQSLICQGIQHHDVFISDNSVLAAGKYFLAEGNDSTFEINKAIFEVLAPCIQHGASDTRRLALVVIRTVSRLRPDLTRPHLALLAPPIFSKVRDVIIPVKLAAEAAFLSIFSVVESDGAVFDKYMAGPGAKLGPGPRRSMSDYFKRVSLRLATQAKERKEAEGGRGGLGLSNDEMEDEREVWSIGKVDIEKDGFEE